MIGCVVAVGGRGDWEGGRGDGTDNPKSMRSIIQIYVPQINFDYRLPGGVSTTLTRINCGIVAMGRSWETLSYKDFKVERDLVHWTRATGLAMWDH